MEIRFKKHVRVICDLQTGDQINILGFGRPLDDNQIYTVKDVQFRQGCESNFMFKIDEYSSYLDSNWATKIEPN